MNSKKKKFKILLAIDIVLIVALAVLMFVQKSGYSEMAKRSAGEQLKAYSNVANSALHEQWSSVDQFGMAWRLVYQALNTPKMTEKAFNEMVTAVENDKQARERQLLNIYKSSGIPDKALTLFVEKGLASGTILQKDENGVKTIACGKNCSVTFTFEKGNLKSTNYEALAKFDTAQFKLDPPPAFRFE